MLQKLDRFDGCKAINKGVITKTLYFSVKNSKMGPFKKEI